MIPKIIHQIWLGNQSKRPYDLINTWKTKNPTWQHVVWTEENMPKSVVEDKFDLCPSYPGKADILRYQLLYMYGGFFVDADSECIRLLDDDLLDCQAFCCWENEYVRTGLMSNGYLASEEGNPFFKILLDKIATLDMNYPPLHTWWHTGPRLLTETVKEYKYNGMYVYPSHYFIPKHYMGIEYKGNGRVYAKQYWGSTPGMEVIYK